MSARILTGYMDDGMWWRQQVSQYFMRAELSKITLHFATTIILITTTYRIYLVKLSIAETILHCYSPDYFENKIDVLYRRCSRKHCA